MVFPVTSALVLTALSFSFTLPVALLGSINKDAVMAAFRNPVRTMFFNVLPSYIQGRARALSVAIVLPMALFVCGLLLWIMQRADNPALFLAPGIAAACLYVWFSSRMNRAYISTLINTLRERLYLPDGHVNMELKGSGEDVLEEISRGVNHADADVTVSFARVLAASFPDQAAGILLERAANSDAATADRLLKLLEDIDLSGHVQHLRTLLADGDPHLQATVIRLLAHLNEPALQGKVLQQVQSTNPRLSASAVHVVLQQAAAGPVTGDVLPAWERLLQGDTPAALAGLALIPDLQHIPPPDRARLESAYRALFPCLLGHESDRVRVRTLRGMREWPHPADTELVTPLAEFLESENPQLRHAAAQSLHLVGAGRRIELLQQALGDGHALVRQAALDCLQKTGADFSVVVPEWIREGSISLRAQQTLLGTEQAAILPEMTLAEIALGKAREAEQLLQALQRLQAEDAASASRRLLEHVLRERFEQTVQLALQALEPLYEPGLIEVIRAGFSSGDERYIANAGEALSNLTDREAASQLHEVLGRARGDCVAPDTGLFHTVRDAVNWCSGQRDAWLQLCAGRVLQDSDPVDAYV